jgi:hypothetical protein
LGFAVTWSEKSASRATFGIGFAGCTVATPERFILPRQCLRDLNRWLKAARVDGAIIGGVATAILGTGRPTHDVDALVVIEDDEWDDFIEPAKRVGFELRDPDGIDFARKHRVLLMRHQTSKVEVDIIFGQLDFAELLECPEIMEGLEQVLSQFFRKRKK